MLLPANCPYAASEMLLPWDGRETIACCRVAGGRAMTRGSEETPLCCCPGDEMYRFVWQDVGEHPFDRPMVQISRQGERIVLHWACGRFFGNGGQGTTSLTMRDWERLKTALDDGLFWLLDPDEERFGLDGAMWLLMGRRSNVFHGVSRWSPEAGPFRDLGRLFFNLSGPPLVGMRL